VHLHVVVVWIVVRVQTPHICQASSVCKDFFGGEEI